MFGSSMFHLAPGRRAEINTRQRRQRKRSHPVRDQAAGGRSPPRKLLGSLSGEWIQGEDTREGSAPERGGTGVQVGGGEALSDANTRERLLPR